MNELREIQAMLAEDPPSADAEARGREKLRAEIRRGRPRVRRPLLAGLGLTTAAAALSLAAATLISAPRAPDPEELPPARPFLLAAAAKQAPASGDYWHVVADSGKLKRVGPAHDPYFIRVSGTDESWMEHPRVEHTGYGSYFKVKEGIGLHGEPATAADREAWKRDGSPGQWGSANTPITETEQCRVWIGYAWYCRIPLRPEKDPYPDGSHTVEGSGPPGEKMTVPMGNFPGVEMRLGALRDLDADPDELREAVLAAMPERLGSRDDRLWLGGTALVTSVPATSEVRRAAYEMLADLPDVKSLGTVTDRLGRTGTAVVHTGKAVPLVDDDVPGDREYRLIVDPATGQALGTEIRLPRPAGEAGSLNPGVLWSYTLIKSAGWTGDMGSGPDSSRD